MKRLKLIKIMASILIGVSSVLAFNPIKASAAYVGQIITANEKTVYADNYQWAYKNGGWMCATPDLHQAYFNAWICTNGLWYYVGQDGYMAHDVFVNDYYVNQNGQWIVGAKYDGRGSVIYPNTSPDTTSTATSNNSNTSTTTSNTSTGTANTTTSTSDTQAANNTNATSSTFGSMNNTQTNTSTNSDTNISNNNTNNSNQTINDITKMFPCWVLIDGKYYYIDKDMRLLYNTTINGYVLGYDGAWVEDDTMDKPTTSKISKYVELLLRQTIQTQSYAADAEKGKQEAKTRMTYIRQQKINELQDKISKWETKGNIDEIHAQLIEQYKAEIKKLQDLNAAQ